MISKGSSAIMTISSIYDMNPRPISIVKRIKTLFNSVGGNEIKELFANHINSELNSMSVIENDSFNLTESDIVFPSEGLTFYSVSRRYRLVNASCSYDIVGDIGPDNMIELDCKLIARLELNK